MCKGQWSTILLRIHLFYVYVNLVKIGNKIPEQDNGLWNPPKATISFIFLFTIK